MMKYDETTGMRGIKQIAKSLTLRDDITPEQKEQILEHYTHNYLNRCYPGWMKEPTNDKNNNNSTVPKRNWYL
jgi:hypothetical protein